MIIANFADQRAATDKPPVLHIDIRIPVPDRDAASLRSMQVLTYLAARRPVDLMALTGSATEEQTVALAGRGIRLLGAGDPNAIRQYLDQHGTRYDLIVMAWSRVATLFLRHARACAPAARLVFDTHDVNHVREFRHARAIGNQTLLRRALAMKRNEMEAIRAADRTIAISDVDRATFAALVPEACIRTVGIWIEPEPGPPPRTEPVILFVGHYLADANVDAARLLATDILPLVRAVVPEARLELAGSDPLPGIGGLGSAEVAVPGWEADLRPRFRRAAVFAAPLRFGSGLKGKILQAMVHRLPIVASAVAVEGTGLVARRDYLPAETPMEFALAILELLTDPEAGHRLAEAAAHVADERFSRAVVERQLDAVFADLPRAPA
jgi:glycosyltransferase involved in cell wall biosynthesis